MINEVTSVTGSNESLMMMKIGRVHQSIEDLGKFYKQKCTHLNSRCLNHKYQRTNQCGYQNILNKSFNLKSSSQANAELVQKRDIFPSSPLRSIFTKRSQCLNNPKNYNFFQKQRPVKTNKLSKAHLSSFQSCKNAKISCNDSELLFVKKGIQQQKLRPRNRAYINCQNSKERIYARRRDTTSCMKKPLHKNAYLDVNIPHLINGLRQAKINTKNEDPEQASKRKITMSTAGSKKDNYDSEVMTNKIKDRIQQNENLKRPFNKNLFLNSQLRKNGVLKEDLALLKMNTYDKKEVQKVIGKDRRNTEQITGLRGQIQLNLDRKIKKGRERNSSKNSMTSSFMIQELLEENQDLKRRITNLEKLSSNSEISINKHHYTIKEKEEGRIRKNRQKTRKKQNNKKQKSKKWGESKTKTVSREDREDMSENTSKKRQFHKDSMDDTVKNKDKHPRNQLATESSEINTKELNKQLVNDLSDLFQTNNFMLYGLNSLIPLLFEAFFEQSISPELSINSLNKLIINLRDLVSQKESNIKNEFITSFSSFRKNSKGGSSIKQKAVDNRFLTKLIHDTLSKNTLDLAEKLAKIHSIKHDQIFEFTKRSQHLEAESSINSDNKHYSNAKEILRKNQHPLKSSHTNDYSCNLSNNPEYLFEGEEKAISEEIPAVSYPLKFGQSPKNDDSSILQNSPTLHNRNLRSARNSFLSAINEQYKYKNSNPSKFNLLRNDQIQPKQAQQALEPGYNVTNQIKQCQTSKKVVQQKKKIKCKSGSSASSSIIQQTSQLLHLRPHKSYNSQITNQYLIALPCNHFKDRYDDLYLDYSYNNQIISLEIPLIIQASKQRSQSRRWSP